MFLGQKIATNIPYIAFGNAAIMQHSNSEDHEHVHTFDPQEGDSCWARLDPTENVWSKGIIIRKVIGVPDSFVEEVDGCRY